MEHPIFIGTNPRFCSQAALGCSGCSMPHTQSKNHMSQCWAAKKSEGGECTAATKLQSPGSRRVCSSQSHDSLWQLSSKESTLWIYWYTLVYPETIWTTRLSIMWPCFYEQHCALSMGSCEKPAEDCKFPQQRHPSIQACALLLMNGSIISRVSKPDTRISLWCIGLRSFSSVQQVFNKCSTSVQQVFNKF